MSPGFEDLRQGDFVKARAGNERLWFSVLSLVGNPANAVLCTVASQPLEAVFWAVLVLSFQAGRALSDYIPTI